jgi:hypothetical protein
MVLKPPTKPQLAKAPTMAARIHAMDAMYRLLLYKKFIRSKTEKIEEKRMVEIL